MKGIFHSTYMGSRADIESAPLTLLGCPLDATSSFRGGTRFGPDSIRKASWTLETYSPYQRRDLDQLIFRDAGDLELRPGNLEYSLDVIENAVKEAVEREIKVLALGGEHLVTFPILKALSQHFRDIQVIHFDAHCDLRTEYEGQTLSHATVMKRVKELGISKLLQIGVRSGTRQEFEEAFLVESPEVLETLLDGDRPVYISFDIDVFDPSLVAGVTTPEPGGLMFKEVINYLSALKNMNIIGADVVELAPDYDTTFVSSVTASKVARELLILASGAK